MPIKNNPPQFTQIQNLLIDALKNTNPILSKMYEGAINVFLSNNPDKICLTAHAIRELMNELPKYIDIAIEDEAKQRLGDFAGKLLSKYEVLLKKTAWPGNPKWEGEIDEHLRAFLCEAETFLESDRKIKTSRADVTRNLIQKHNHSSIPLPKPIENNKVKEWKNYNYYFTRVAHHSSTTEEELLSHLTHFEDLLLHYLRPQTFIKQKEILEIISEGEANGK